MAVADTSYLIALQHGNPVAVKLQHKLETQGDLLRIPAIAWMEFLWGLPPAKRQAAAGAVAAAVVIVPFDAELAAEAAALQDAAMAKGRRLSWTDLAIAATARGLGQSLCTLDETFQGLPGVRVILVETA